MVILGALATVAHGETVSLSLNNPSFESGPMFTGGPDDDAEGWNHPTSATCGVAEHPTSHAYWDTLPSDGTVRGFFSNQDVNLDQPTSHVVQAGYTYTLSADLGQPNVTPAHTGIGIELWVDGLPGGITQAATVHIPLAEFVAGGWIQRSVSFTDEGAYTGGTLFIRFHLTGGLQPWLDNVILQEESPVAVSTLLKPRPYQVIQRSGFVPAQAHPHNPGGPALGSASVALQGIFPEVTGEAFEFRAVPLTDAFGDGCDWTSLAVTRQVNTWSGSAEIPAGGWYRIEVRSMLDTELLSSASAEPVGVGEVFLTAGQSYSGGSGDELMSVDDPQGRIVSYDVGTDTWVIANDPQPNDIGDGGTIWVPMANVLLDKLRVPIGFVHTGGDGIPSRLWLPGEPNYNQVLAAGQALQNFRAVLWQQGESDVIENTPTATYYSNLTTIRSSLVGAWGIEPVWLAAKSTRHTIYVKPNEEQAIRDAISQLWTTPGFGQGPDTDLLGGENRGGPGTRWHFTGVGQRNAGAMWFAVLWHELNNN